MGFLERWTALCHARSPQAPLVYHKLTGLFCLSAVVGRNCSIESGPRTIYPNIWVLLVGPSSDTKKTTVLGFAQKTLNSVASEMRLADSSSVEGFVAEMADKSESGVCQVWSIKDEFGGLISGMKRKDYLSDLKDVMMQLFDGQSEITRRLHKVHYKIDPVYYCLATATTAERLEQILGPEDVSDGFFPRFLGVEAKSNGYVPMPLSLSTQLKQEQADLETILSQIRAAYQTYKTEFSFDFKAQKNYNEWCLWIKEYLASAGPTVSRLQDYFLKFLMLYEISNKSAYAGLSVQISPDMVAQVEEDMYDFVERNKALYDVLGGNADIEHLYRIIWWHGIDGCSYKEALRRSHFFIKKFNAVMETLIASGRVVHTDTLMGKRLVATERLKEVTES